MQDEKIVELYFERNEEALGETQRKYGRYLYKIAYGILSDKADSEESVNDTYLAAWRSIPPQRPSVLATYLGKLTRRISIDIFRRKTSSKRGSTQYTLSLSELEDCVKEQTSLEESLESKELAMLISAFLRTLPEEKRVLFVCRYYYMDSLKDSARYLGISEAKAKSLLHRTRILLREYLEKEGYAV